MIDSGASVDVGLKWFAQSSLQESDGSVQLRGSDGRTLQEYGKRETWLKIGNNVRQYDFHVVGATKPILSVSYLCENGTATHLAGKSFSEVRRRTRTPATEKWCGLRQHADRSQSQRHNRIMRTSWKFTKVEKVMRTS